MSGPFHLNRVSWGRAAARRHSHYCGSGFGGQTTGYATIIMPDYFEALNRDYRYQLTIVDDGESLPDFVFTRVVGAMKNRQFTIKTSLPSVQVSCMVTGIRQHAWDNKNRIPNSVDKMGDEKGKLM